jgi:hypothetical protein
MDSINQHLNQNFVIPPLYFVTWNWRHRLEEIESAAIFVREMKACSSFLPFEFGLVPGLLRV